MQSINGVKMPQFAELGTLGDSIRQVNGQFSASKFPASSLLAQLDASRVTTAKLGALTTGLAGPSWMADMQKFTIGLTESFQLTRNFALNNPGLTAALAAFRSATVVDDSFSRQITRIGKGWASLTDRVLGSYPQLALLTIALHPGDLSAPIGAPGTPGAAYEMSD